MELNRNAISDVTRRDIVDMLVLRDAPFHGRLNLMDFLKRVWPLDEMPSEDHRYNSATGDIATHMGFGDWDESHLLLERLYLSRGPDDEFLRFLEEVVHPLVVPDQAEVLNLVTAINRSIERDGFHLVETDRISGKPTYGAKPVSFVRAAPEPTLWEKVDRQVRAMRDQVTRAASEEEYQTVGHLGREVMISLAQAVIDPAEAIGEDGKPPSPTDAAPLLEVYIGKTLPGRGNEALRRAVRGAVKATSAVLHDRKGYTARCRTNRGTGVIFCSLDAHTRNDVAIAVQNDFNRSHLPKTIGRAQVRGPCRTRSLLTRSWLPRVYS